MKTRKLLAMLLSLVLSVGLMTTAAMAEGTNVAKIGETEYATLAAAVENAQDGNTITLLDSITVDTETYTIEDGVSISLDMNGKTITVTDNKTSGNYELFYIYGGLSVTGNGTIELTATTDRAWNASSSIFHNRGGVLTIANGTYTHKGGTDMAYVVDNSGNYYGDATTNITDGTLTSSYIAIRNRMEQNSHGYSGKAILNVSGGIISGTSRAIWAQAASTSETAPATGEINVSGGEIGLIDTARSNGAKCMTTISGGTVSAFKGEVGELAVTGTGSITGDVTILTAGGEETGYTVSSDGHYITLAAAVAQSGTVTLRGNVTLTDTLTIPSGKTVTLDLAGYTISQTKAQTSAYQMILNDGNLTIVDSVGGGKISYIDSGNGGEYISDTIYNRGVLVIDGGTIENLSGATVATNGYPHAVDTYSGIRDTSVTINDGTIYCAEYSAIRMFCVSATYKADLVINGGTIKGAVDMQNGTAAEALGALTINGGTFETTKNTNNIRFANWNPNATTYGITASIKGGSFNGGVSTTYVPDDANWDSKIITGGTFTASAVNNIDSNLLAQDFAFVENPDGSYGVVKLEPVAEVNGTQYTDLQAAIDVADGKTVTLVNGLALTETVTISAGKTVTLDLNGKTISGTDTKAAGNFELIANRGTLTISDTAGTGKITLTAETDRNWNAYSAVIANLQGTLTVNGGTIEHLGGTDMAYGIDNNTNGNLGDATLTVNGGTIKSTYRAIRQFANSDSKTNTLTINGGTVSGDNRAVWLQSANEKANKAGMTITGTADVGSVYVWAPENGNASALTLSVAAANVEEVVDGIAANTDHGVVLSNGTYCVQETTVDVTGVTLDKSTASLYAGNSITLTATVAPENATINNVTWSSSDEAVATVDSTGKVTAVAAGTATVTATAGGQTAACTVTVTRASSGGGGSASYTITAEDTENGSVTVSPSRASSGSTVTITVEPDSGYELDELVVLDKNGKEIKLTQKSGSKYTFKMPSGKVSIEATFAEIEEYENPFVDVAEGAYYYDAVLWAAENGITGGTSATTFSPAVTCTRAQTVTFLWRAAGSPEPETTVCPFTDVTPDKYYYDAVLWAVENGITAGTSATTFSPDATVTRAQNVTFLWRWAEASAVETVNPFTDVAADMYYHDAVLWAADEGITAGTSATTFSPDDPCLRSQIVTFLYRFLAQ